MTDWTSGYVADIGYTYGYYLELNPQRVKLAFLNAGLVAPEFGTACELGFGQGISANIHAAASVCSWHGTDFNPAQAGFAQELASVSGANAHLFDEAFAEFSGRDLPEFDYIGLHGIWSWISVRIPVNVTADSGNVTGNSGERDRGSVLRVWILCRFVFPAVFPVLNWLVFE